MTGSGSTWTNGDHLTVGSLGTGMLDVVAGGAVSNADGYIGRSTGGTGIVTVTGAGSTWDQ